MAVLSTIGKVLMGAGLIGIAVAFISARQQLLTWAVVAISAGLAMIFLREAFRPRIKPED
jgi:hypothetical protein